MFNSNFVFNEMFKQIRQELGFTQKEFAKLLHCTQSQVSRIERNERPVTEALISDLSSLYKFDLRSNLSVFENFSNYTVFDKYSKLILFQNITNYDAMDLLESELNDPIIDKEFNKGELYLLKNVLRAVVHCLKYQHFDTAIEYCLLNLECKEEELYTLCPTTFKSSFYYMTISVLAISLFSVGKAELALALSANFSKHYNTVWSNQYINVATSDSVYNQHYLFFNVLYAFMLLSVGEFQKSIDLCDFTIEECKKRNVININHYILFVKFQSHYCNNEIDVAKEIYSDFVSHCKYVDLPKSIIAFTGFNIDKFPKLFI